MHGLMTLGRQKTVISRILMMMRAAMKDMNGIMKMVDG
jgi:hypothetical protein